MAYLRVVPFLLMAVLLVGCASSGSQSDSSTLSAPEDEKTAEELYQEAQTAMRQEDFTGAATQLENLQARYPFGAYFKQAQLDLINAYYQAQEMGSAIAAADRFMRLNPQDPNVPYALYMRGRANLERGNDFLTRTFEIDRRTRDPGPLRESMQDFTRLIERFADSKYADDARQRVSTLRNYLAHYELHVANFYMKRGAYVAAVNRAQSVLEDYQGTPAVRDALGILAEAYTYLELSDLRADILRIIRRNYPDHPALSDSGAGA